MACESFCDWQPVLSPALYHISGRRESKVHAVAVGPSGANWFYGLSLAGPTLGLCHTTDQACLADLTRYGVSEDLISKCKNVDNENINCFQGSPTLALLD